MRAKTLGNKRWDGESVLNSVNNFVPSDIKGLRAFMSDKIGSQTFKEMLDKDDSIRTEVDLALFDTVPEGAEKGDGVIDDTELEEFKKAIVDPYSHYWYDENGETDMNKWMTYARQIVVEKLTNTIENKHIEDYPREEISDDSLKNTLSNIQTKN